MSKWHKFVDINDSNTGITTLQILTFFQGHKYKNQIQ